MALGAKAPASHLDGSAECLYACVSGCMCLKTHFEITGDSLTLEESSLFKKKKKKKITSGVCLLSFAFAVLNPSLMLVPYHALCFLVVGSEDERFN